MQLLRPDAGSIRFEGRDLAEMKRRSAGHSARRFNMSSRIRSLR